MAATNTATMPTVAQAMEALGHHLNQPGVRGCKALKLVFEFLVEDPHDHVRIASMFQAGIDGFQPLTARRREPAIKVTKNSTAPIKSNVVPLRLVKDNISRDTIEVLENLLVGARQGEVTGIAFAATLKHERFLTDVAGHCYTNPTYARGIVAFLSDELADHVHSRDASEVR